MNILELFIITLKFIIHFIYTIYPIFLSFMPPNAWVFNRVYLEACHSWARPFIITTFPWLRFALHCSSLFGILRDDIEIKFRFIYTIYIVLSLLDTFKPICWWFGLLNQYIILKNSIFSPFPFNPKNTYL